MSGCVVWLTGDRGRMDAIADALRAALGAAAPAFDALTAELVEDRLCSNEPRNADFRDIVVRRLGWLCQVLARHGCVAVAVAASPRREVRDAARAAAGGGFVEVLVRGAMPDGYELPLHAEVDAPPGEAPAAVAAHIRRALADHGLAAAEARAYSVEEEARILHRLERIGHL